MLGKEQIAEVALRQQRWTISPNGKRVNIDASDGIGEVLIRGRLQDKVGIGIRAEGDRAKLIVTNEGGSLELNLYRERGWYGVRDFVLRPVDRLLDSIGEVWEGGPDWP